MQDEADIVSVGALVCDQRICIQSLSLEAGEESLWCVLYVKERERESGPASATPTPTKPAHLGESAKELGAGILPQGDDGLAQAYAHTGNRWGKTFSFSLLPAHSQELFIAAYETSQKQGYGRHKRLPSAVEKQGGGTTEST